MNKKNIMAFVMPEDLDKLIAEYCNKNDLNQSQVIRLALRKFFNIETK